MDFILEQTVLEFVVGVVAGGGGLDFYRDYAAEVDSFSVDGYGVVSEFHSDVNIYYQSNIS